MDCERAEEKKSKGNEEFKKGNYRAAISFYTEAIGKIQIMKNNNSVCVDIFPSNEAILTNRAVAYINLKDYDRAMSDCKNALMINPKFGKAYKRMFKCQVARGELEVSCFYIYLTNINRLFVYRKLSNRLNKLWS